MKISIPHLSLRNWGGFLLFCSGYLVLHSVFVFGKMFPSSKNEQGYHGKLNLGFHHKIPDYLFETRQFFEMRKDISNIFLFPPSRSNVYEWGYAGAGDITLNLFNRGLLFQQYGEGFAPPNDLDSLYQMTTKFIFEGDESLVAGFFQLLNSRYLLQRNDFVYDFFGDQQFDPERIRRALAQVNFKLIKSFGKWDVYQKTENPLPVLYAPSQVYATETSQMPKVFLGSAYNERAAFFFSKEDRQKIKSLPDSLDPPFVEFKRINPSKFRIRLHNIQDDFVLVFSQTFHPGWKVYRGPIRDAWPDLSARDNLGKYKILDGNEDLQASALEVENFISQGKVSSLGNGDLKTRSHKTWGEWKEIIEKEETFHVDFISKETFGSIQNDNLPNGRFFETWFLPNLQASHVRANAFANSWIIKSDDSKSAELILEFSPIRFFYLGVFISSLLIFILVAFLLGSMFLKKAKRAHV